MTHAKDAEYKVNLKIRNSKSETISNDQKSENSKQPCFGFRYSNFGFYSKKAGVMRSAWFGMIGLLIVLAVPDANAQKPERLAVGYGSISTNYLPLWMAKEAGIFRKNGLDVDTVFFTSSTTAFMALLAGETAITINPGPDVVNAHLAGADVVFVAGGTVALDWWLVSRPEIKTAALLRGGAVGISRFGSSSEFIARYALQKIGLTPGKDTTIVQIGSPLSRQAAMDTRKVQATVYTAIHTFTAEKKGFNVLADLAALGLPYQNAAVVTTRKLTKEKPEIIGRFVRSQLEAVHLLKTDRENGLKVLAKYMQGLNDREVLEKAYDRAVAEDMLPRNQYPSLEGIKTVLDTLVEQNPKIKTVKPEIFVDPRFIQELDANGFIDGLYKRR
jgi:NitT/TauT family transport system substrate-binding protein